jgi:hypothetical protein
MHSIVSGKQRSQREKNPEIGRHHQMSTEPNSLVRGLQYEAKNHGEFADLAKPIPKK